MKTLIAFLLLSSTALASTPTEIICTEASPNTYTCEEHLLVRMQSTTGPFYALAIPPKVVKFVITIAKEISKEAAKEMVRAAYKNITNSDKPVEIKLLPAH